MTDEQLKAIFELRKLAHACRSAEEQAITAQSIYQRWLQEHNDAAHTLSKARALAKAGGLSEEQLCDIIRQGREDWERAHLSPQDRGAR